MHNLFILLNWIFSDGVQNSHFPFQLQFFVCGKTGKSVENAVNRGERGKPAATWGACPAKAVVVAGALTRPTDKAQASEENVEKKKNEFNSFVYFLQEETPATPPAPRPVLTFSNFSLSLFGFPRNVCWPVLVCQVQAFGWLMAEPFGWLMAGSEWGTGGWMSTTLFRLRFAVNKHKCDKLYLTCIHSHQKRLIANGKEKHFHPLTGLRSCGFFL